MIWYRAEVADTTWTAPLPPCPCCLTTAARSPDSAKWHAPTTDLHGYHVGAKWCMRSVVGSGKNLPAEQCCYNSRGWLITAGSGAGSADRINSDQWWSQPTHWQCDVQPADIAKAPDGGTFGQFSELYLKARPTGNKMGC